MNEELFNFIIESGKQEGIEVRSVYGTNICDFEILIGLFAMGIIFTKEIESKLVQNWYEEIYIVENSGRYIRFTCRTSTDLDFNSTRVLLNTIEEVFPTEEEVTTTVINYYPHT